VRSDEEDLCKILLHFGAVACGLIFSHKTTLKLLAAGAAPHIPLGPGAYDAPLIPWSAGKGELSPQTPPPQHLRRLDYRSLVPCIVYSI
jgi:hypothetical protein